MLGLTLTVGLVQNTDQQQDLGAHGFIYLVFVSICVVFIMGHLWELFPNLRIVAVPPGPGSHCSPADRESAMALKQRE